MENISVVKYKGYVLTEEVIDEEDVSKIWQDVFKDGERVSFSFTPYEYVSREFFEAWIDAGCPKGSEVGVRGNFRNGDIDKLAQ